MPYRDDSLPEWADELIDNLRSQVQELQAQLFIADMELAEERERHRTAPPVHAEPPRPTLTPLTAAPGEPRPQIDQRRPRLRVIPGGRGDPPARRKEIS